MKSNPRGMRENAPAGPRAPRKPPVPPGGERSSFAQPAVAEHLREHLASSESISPPAVSQPGFSSSLPSMPAIPRCCQRGPAKGSPSEGRGTGTSCPTPSALEAALCSPWELLGAQKPRAQEQMLIAMFYLLHNANAIAMKCWATRSMAAKSKATKRIKGSSMPQKSTWTSGSTKMSSVEHHSTPSMGSRLAAEPPCRRGPSLVGDSQSPGNALSPLPDPETHQEIALTLDSVSMAKMCSRKTFSFTASPIPLHVSGRAGACSHGLTAPVRQGHGGAFGRGPGNPVPCFAGEKLNFHSNFHFGSRDIGSISTCCFEAFALHGRSAQLRVFNYKAHTYKCSNSQAYGF